MRVPGAREVRPPAVGLSRCSRRGDAGATRRAGCALGGDRAAGAQGRRGGGSGGAKAPVA